ncbi:hypothetical protein llap_11606 [Limosa lapponica baueri]|uniref:Uncharacterized protein n=1 Tax=Limosa lapponica baueri TaxID=1758121 RepID=A0A2I0TWB8_LIMLA|nr:hypothetical protein llap_11606 [Limosa lapponica baueri]
MDENKSVLMLRGLQWDHCQIRTSRALLGAIVMPVSFLLTWILVLTKVEKLREECGFSGYVMLPKPKSPVRWGLEKVTALEEPASEPTANQTRCRATKIHPAVGGFGTGAYEIQGCQVSSRDPSAPVGKRLDTGDSAESSVEDFVAYKFLSRKSGFTWTEVKLNKCKCPATYLSLITRMGGALAPDGLIELVGETPLTQPLLRTSSSGYKPPPKLSSDVVRGSRNATSQVSASLAATTANKQQLFEAEAEERVPCIILEIQWTWLALRL